MTPGDPTAGSSAGHEPATDAFAHGCGAVRCVCSQETLRALLWGLRYAVPVG